MAIAEIKGGVPVKLWTPLDEVESEALTQLRNISNLPWVFKHVAAMPDVHFGKGATVGSVIAMKNAVSPAAVGVDIGCVDGETEFLSRQGWKRIDQYQKGDEVLQYEPEEGTATFVLPDRYISRSDGRFFHLRTKYGVDQMLSNDHRVLYVKTARPGKPQKLAVIRAEELVAKHRARVLGWRGRFLTTFSYASESTSLPLSDAEIRVMVMVMADGHYVTDNSVSSRVSLRLQKERKINRARELLKSAGIAFEEIPFSYLRHGETVSALDLRFYAPLREKSMHIFWRASSTQIQIISEEALHWDGNLEKRCFYTRDKASADFMHFAFAASGFRSVMRADAHSKDGRIDYRVFAHRNTRVGIHGKPKCSITEHVGGQEYCFTVPTGFWVMRRGGNIAITGNCGMGAFKTNLRASDLPDSLKAIRAAIERSVPVGFNAHGSPVVEGFFKHGADMVFARELKKRFAQITPTFLDMESRVWNQCGTLGGGNHFIELCLDTEQTVWLLLHSGSRNIGKTLAEHHIGIAKKLAHNQTLPDRDLAVFLSGTPEMVAYRNDLMWAQDYAMLNRMTMVELCFAELKSFFPEIRIAERILCHHNYVSEETHFGEAVIVTRKGAINAEAGKLGLIPGSMGARSFVVRGLGNPESFCSASHGAGRRMSRGAAKRRFTVEDVAEQTRGVECRKDAGVIDEIPAAYKDIQQVMDNQQDLVEIVSELRQVMCIKG